jgi:hypothetical protein
VITEEIRASFEFSTCRIDTVSCLRSWNMGFHRFQPILLS